MLERVAARLESGGSHLLRSSGQRVTKRATLPPTIYIRGCGRECGELGWTPPGDGWSGRDIECLEDDAAPKIPPRIKRAHTLHFDFLYPSKTLAFLEHLSTAVPPRATPVAKTPGGVFSLGGARRGYATAVEPPAVVEGPLPEVGRRNPPKNLEELQKQVELESRLWKSQSEAETLHAKKFSRLQSLAWEFYQDEGCPEDPTNRDFLINYFLHDLTKANATRVVEVVGQVPLKERNTVCWDAMVIAHLTLDNEPAAFECLVWIKNNLEVITDRGYERYIAYQVGQNRWDYVLKAYSLLRCTRYKTVRGYKEMARYTHRMQLQSYKLESYNPGYGKEVIPWAMSLPEEPVTRLEIIKDELALELVRGWCWIQCAFTQYWTPEYQKVWDWMTARERWRPFISRKRWQDAIWNAARSKRWDLVLRLYNDWVTHDNPQKISVFTLNYVMDAHAALGDEEAIVKMIDEVFRVSPLGRPGRRTYIVLFNFYGAKGDTERVEKLLAEYRTHYPIDSPADLHGVMEAYNNFVDLKRPDADRTASVDSLIIWFSRIREEFGLEPDAGCYNILIQGVAKGGDLSVTMAWFKEMIEARHMPDRKTFNAIMNLYGKHGYWESAEQLLEFMYDKGFPRTSEMYHGLMKAYQKVGELEASYHVLQRTEADIKVATTPMYNTAISGFLNAGETERARRVFVELQNKGLKFDEMTYAISIHWVLLVKDMKTAEEVATRMWKLGRPISPNVYLNIMTSYMKSGSPYEACETFLTMLARGLKPGLKTLSVFMKAYGSMPKASRYHISSQFDANMSKQMCDIVLNSENERIPVWLMNQVVEINQQHGLLPDSLKLFQKFHTQNYRETNMKYWSRMMVIFKQAGDLNNLFEMYTSYKNSCRRRFFQVTNLAIHRKVLSTHRFYMCLPLQIWMDAMIQTGNIDIKALESEIKELLSQGYELNNENWNSWVQCLALAGDIPRAAVEFEKELAFDWQNFRIWIRYQRRLRGPDEPDLVFDARSSHRRPFTKTIATLATEVDALSRRRWAGDIDAERLLINLQKTAPHLLESFRMFDDMPARIDRSLLYRLSRLQDIEANKRELAEVARREALKNITPGAEEAEDPVGELVNRREDALPTTPAPLAAPAPPQPQWPYESNQQHPDQQYPDQYNQQHPVQQPQWPYESDQQHPQGNQYPYPAPNDYDNPFPYPADQPAQPPQEEMASYNPTAVFQAAEAEQAPPLTPQQQQHILLQEKLKAITRATVEADLRTPESTRERPPTFKERMQTATKREKAGLPPAKGGRQEELLGILELVDKATRKNKGGSGRR